MAPKDPAGNLLDADALNDLLAVAADDWAEPDAATPVATEAPRGARPGPVPYGDLSYLVIEDSPTMRAWLRNAIADAGGKRIDMADTYFDALNRIRTKGGYDIVLCDYILSDARDGQQLLDEVRRNRMLPQATLWIMITGEQKYEQVFSAAELAPDDYLIKPITPALLADRIQRAWDRRSSLKAATQLYDAGRYAEAIEVCRKMTESRARFSIGFRRIAGECLLALEYYRDAHDHYEAILEEFPRLPWAKLGKGRAFFHMDRHDETHEILQDLVASNPDFLQAHDLLAKVHEKRGNLEEARDLLKLVLQKNPKALHRHREVVRVATATGDTDSAIEAFALMHQHGKGSSFIRPGDFCEYANLLTSSGSKAARDRLDNLGANLRDFHRADPEFQFAGQMVGYAAATAAGRSDEAKQAYAQMRQTLRKALAAGDNVDTSEHLAMLAAAAAMGDAEMAEECAYALYADHLGNTSMTARIDAAMAGAGLDDAAARLRAKAGDELRQLNVAAVNLAKHGKFKEAIEEFLRLADNNRSVTVYLNAATAIIKLYHEIDQGRQVVSPPEHRRYCERMERTLAYVGKHDPGNVKMAKIADEWRNLLKSPAFR
ncbi:MAG: response regulator [Pseudomonadota bacterium]